MTTISIGAGWPVIARVFFALVVLVLLAATPEHLFAQAGLMDTLKRMDIDGDGELDIEEITPQSRPFLERVAAARRMSLDREHDLKTWQDAARAYFAVQNGVQDRRVEPQREGAIRGFDGDAEQVVVPEFGLAEVKYPYTEGDLREARRTLYRSDRDRDGYLSRDEARDAEWTHNDPFDMDLDQDDRLSRLELAQRYARRRLLEGSTSELLEQYLRDRERRGPQDGQAWRDGSNNENDERRRWRRGGSETWLTGSILERFDANRDGQLTEEEAVQLGVSFGRLDIDGDGFISRSELQTHMVALQEEAGGDATLGIPGWFYERDTDRDGQVSMSEYTAEWTDASFTEFSKLDLNEDGLITKAEVLESKAVMGGNFVNETAEVLPPQRTVISEIEIKEDLWIRDLDVMLSITHTRTGHLDGYLTGPDGLRVELFSDVGGDGDNFAGTRFDDQGDRPIVKSQPPFEGNHQPKGLTRGEPGLSAFNGKNAKGIWQLVIRGTRSDRFGMLHQWSLIIQPEEKN